MKFSFLLLSIFFSNPFFIAAFQDETAQKARFHQAAIIVVANKAKENIEISTGARRESVRPGLVRLKTLFVIPFVSMKDYMKEIHGDKTYVPGQALKITTSTGTYGLWEDERGIQLCKIETSLLADSHAECILTKHKLASEPRLTLHVQGPSTFFLS